MMMRILKLEKSLSLSRNIIFPSWPAEEFLWMRFKVFRLLIKGLINCGDCLWRKVTHVGFPVTPIGMNWGKWWSYIHKIWWNQLLHVRTTGKPIVLLKSKFNIANMRKITLKCQWKSNDVGSDQNQKLCQKLYFYAIFKLKIHIYLILFICYF